MPKSKSAGDRYWIENHDRYAIVNMYLKRVNKKPNIHHIMSVNCGL